MNCDREVAVNEVRPLEGETAVDVGLAVGSIGTDADTG